MAARKDSEQTLGIWVTILYPLVVVLLFHQAVIELFTDPKAGEIGGFLGGVVGPIALLWVILGYRQNSFELELSRQALLAQAEQLERSASEQADLVRVTREALELQVRAEALRQAELTSRYSPRFVATVGSVRGGVAPLAEYDFTVRNEGADIVRAKVSFEGALGFQPVDIGEWRTDADHDFSVKRARDGYQLVMVIDYQDRIGQSHQARFLLRQMGLGDAQFEEVQR